MVSESDQRAAGNLAARMPRRPIGPAPPTIEFADFQPSNPYEDVAASLRQQILDGVLPAGLPVPPVKELARQHEVSVGTVQRAVELVKQWGLIEVNPGRRNLVRRPFSAEGKKEGAPDGPVDYATRSRSVPSSPEPLDLEIRKLGQVVSTVRRVNDPTDYDLLGKLLSAAVTRNGDSRSEIDRYEMVVRRAGEPDSVMIFVASAP